MRQRWRQKGGEGRRWPPVYRTWLLSFVDSRFSADQPSPPHLYCGLISKLDVIALTDCIAMYAVADSLGLFWLARLVAVCAVFIILAHLQWQLKFHPLSKYPGPILAKISDFYSLYFIAWGNLHIQQRLLHQRYGPVVRIGPNKLIFNTSTALHEIYTSRNVQKNAGYPATDPVPGHSHIFTTVNKDVHRLKRKALSPGFSDQFIRKFETTIIKSVDEFVLALLGDSHTGTDGDWSSPQNLTDRCKYFTLDVMGDFGFGRSFNVQNDTKFRGIILSLQTGGYTGGIYSQFESLRSLHPLRYYRAKGAVNMEQHGKWVKEMIGERMSIARDAKPDLFSFVSETKDPETGSVFTPDDLWAESRFLLIAGSDTSATVLASVFFYLSRYGECHQRLQQELTSTFATSDDIRLGAALSGCLYLRAVVDESMRLSPPVSNALWREVLEPGITLDGDHMPSGVEIGVSLYSLFHSEAIFPEPDVFIPERFLENGRFKDCLHEARAAFKPFSLGSRGCAGINLAYAEILLLVAKSVWTLEFKQAQGEQGKIGEGSGVAMRGRQVVNEFQMKAFITAMHDGPYLQFRRRNGH